MVKGIRQITYTEGTITTSKALWAELLKVSKANPKKYVTSTVIFGEVWVYICDRKPSSTSSHGAEDMYRSYGGFLKDGEIVKPSKSFIAKYNYCPILN